MNDDEHLREALLELELLRGREAERLRETRALLAALEALTGSTNIDAGIASLLSNAKSALDCDRVVFFENRDGVLVDVSPCVDPAARSQWSAPGLLTRPRRIVDIAEIAGLWDNPPEQFLKMRSLLSVPFGDDTQRVVLAAFSEERGRFTASDSDLLARMAAVASQAILRRSLESRNEFLAAVIDKSPVSVAIADVGDELPLIYVNDAFVELTGYDRSEILGQNCRLLSAEDPDSDVRREIRRTVVDRTTGTFTLRNRKKSGEIFWNELRLFPVNDADGNVSHIVATQTDATQRMQAEMDRDAARRRLEGALTATTEAFLVLGKDGNVRFANASFEKFLAPLKVSQDAVLPDKAVSFLLGPRYRGPVENPAAALASAFNHEIATQDGRQFIVRSRAIPDGGVVVAASDITQFKVNERALRQRLAVIERSQDGVAIGDRDGRLIDVNPSLLALWGCNTEEDVLGRKWTKFYDASSAEAFSSSQAWFQSTGVWRGEAEVTRDGTVFVHDVSLSLIPEVGSVLIVRDITERRRNTEERADLRRRLDRAQMQERLHQVSAGLAHDFNNLLSAILGSASLIEGAESLTSDARDAVKRIQLAANRAAELTDSFLDLGSREKSAERVELGAVLRNTVDLVRGGAPRGVRLSASLQDTPLIVEASQTDILQVVMNLVVNGIDAHEGMPGEVRVSVRRGMPEACSQIVVGTPNSQRNYAAIVVEDTGKGMAPETLENVLEPYFTTKGNSGTGLGLAIVGSILNDNEALLQVDTAPGRGTVFTVWWPISSTDETTPERPVSRGLSREGLPILVLDDVADVATAIASELSSAGYEVAEANDPDVALDTLAEDPEGWACLVSDYDMPGMNGGDLIAALEHAAPGLPVIIVSALARRLTDKRLTAATAVLQKPVNKDKLLAAVRAATTTAQTSGGE